jgi:hypothetical protein
MPRSLVFPEPSIYSLKFSHFLLGKGPFDSASLRSGRTERGGPILFKPPLEYQIRPSQNNSSGTILNMCDKNVTENGSWSIRKHPWSKPQAHPQKDPYRRK